MIHKIDEVVLVSFDDMIAHDIEEFNDLIESKINKGLLSDICYEIVGLGACKNVVRMRVTGEAEDMVEEG